MVVDDGRVHLQSKMVMSFPRNLEIVLSGPVVELPQLPSCRVAAVAGCQICRVATAAVAKLPGCRSRSCRVAPAAVAELPQLTSCRVATAAVAGCRVAKLRGCRSRSCRVATAAVAGVPLRSARLSLNSKCFCCSPVSQLEAFTSLSSLSFVGSPVPQLVETENETKIFSYVVLMF